MQFCFTSERQTTHPSRAKVPIERHISVACTTSEEKTGRGGKAANTLVNAAACTDKRQTMSPTCQQCTAAINRTLIRRAWRCYGQPVSSTHYNLPPVSYRCPNDKFKTFTIYFKNLNSFHTTRLGGTWSFDWTMANEDK